MAPINTKSHNKSVRLSIIPVDETALLPAQDNTPILKVPQRQEPAHYTARQSPMLAAAPHTIPPDHILSHHGYLMRERCIQASNHIATVAAAAKLFPLVDIEIHAANVVVDSITGKTHE